jgi:hypothetical protein
MASETPMFEVGAEVLGYVGIVATWRRSAPNVANRHMPMLTIQQAASTDEGVHEPAQSITLQGAEKLLALRAAIDEALKGGAK